MFSAGNLVVVNTQRVVLNSRIWTVTDIKRTDGRVVLSSADGLLSDVGAVKHIAMFAENVTHLAVVPANRALAPSVGPSNQAEEGEMLARFVFGNTGGGSGGNGGRSVPPLNTWINLPLLGDNSIMLTRNDDPHYDLVYLPQFRGYQLHFYSDWAGEYITLQNCDILKVCPKCQIWPWCAYCKKFLFPVARHRGSIKHNQCLDWCRERRASREAWEACFPADL